MIDSQPATSVLGVGFWLCLSVRAGTGAPAASGYIGALILCAAATCAGALAACATPRKNPR